MNISQQNIRLVHWLLDQCECNPELFALVTKRMGQFMHFTPDAVRQALESLTLRSLDERVGRVRPGDGTEHRTLGDVTPASGPSVEDLADATSIEPLVSDALKNNLSPREQKVLTMRFGLGGAEVKTLREVGEVINASSEQVRNIQIKALAKLWHDPIIKQLNGV